MSTWETNSTIPDIGDWLRSCRHIAVLTHMKPDGDALGSSLGAARAIRHATDGKTLATPWYAGPMPPYADDLAEDGEMQMLREFDIPERDYDGVLVVDTGSWSQLDPMAPWLRDRHDITAIVDHHRQGDADVAARRYIDTDAAAASQIVGELACHLFGVRCVSKVPTPVCEPLMIGLAADTGWFRHSNTNARAMHFGAKLLEAGVDHARCHALSEQRDRPGRLRLMGRALESMELLMDGRLALMTVLERDFEEVGASQGDSGGFSDLPLSIATVQVGAVITEGRDDQGPIAKVSMRSKPGPNAIDVNNAARQLGGGGHARAAGARMRCDMQEARRRVLEALG